ncbi:hypothetical protein [Nocardia brevicatena]|uniref:hypothetical protein n=1 Tax=Nocardia brevicatena TaxID=37327 RepID=UPI0002EA2311|nr:hypothetical protein [Nocardia brevicatena]
MPRKQIPTDTTTADVVDLTARRRCHLERSGLDPVSVAVHLYVETGSTPDWDYAAYRDDGSGWAA